MFEFVLCKDSASENNESSLSNCRTQPILCKDNKKAETQQEFLLFI